MFRVKLPVKLSLPERHGLESDNVQDIDNVQDTHHLAYTKCNGSRYFLTRNCGVAYSCAPVFRSENEGCPGSVSGIPHYFAADVWNHATHAITSNAPILCCTVNVSPSNIIASNRTNTGSQLESIAARLGPMRARPV